MSELQYTKQAISNKRKEIAKRESEIEEQLTRILESLKPKESSKPKEEELSNEDNLPRENIPVWISGYILHGIGRKQIELSEDRQNIPKDKLEHDIDKCVEAIIRTYG
jgi:hypothetical protein